MRSPTTARGRILRFPTIGSLLFPCVLALGATAPEARGQGGAQHDRILQSLEVAQTRSGPEIRAAYGIRIQGESSPEPRILDTDLFVEVAGNPAGGARLEATVPANASGSCTGCHGSDCPDIDIGSEGTCVTTSATCSCDYIIVTPLPFPTLEDGDRIVAWLAAAKGALPEPDTSNDSLTIVYSLVSALAATPAFDLVAAPNPAASGVRIDVRLPAEAPIEIEVFDLHGRRVRSLASGKSLPAGIHAFTWDGRDGRGRRLPPGVYLVSLAAAERRLSRRVVLIR